MNLYQTCLHELTLDVSSWVYTMMKSLLKTSCIGSDKPRQANCAWPMHWFSKLAIGTTVSGDATNQRWTKFGRTWCRKCGNGQLVNWCIIKHFSSQHYLNCEVCVEKLLSCFNLGVCNRPLNLTIISALLFLSVHLIMFTCLDKCSFRLVTEKRRFRGFWYIISMFLEFVKQIMKKKATNYKINSDTKMLFCNKRSRLTVLIKHN